MLYNYYPQKKVLFLKNRIWYFLIVYMFNYASSTKMSELFRQVGMYQSLLVSLYYLKLIFSWTLKIINLNYLCISVKSVDNLFLNFLH